MFEIKREALFVPVDAHEIGTLAVLKWRSPPTRVVALTGLFDLDDPRTHIGEHHCAVWSREDSREVENRHARQRAFALSPGLVADGRDMGTVVFQDAPLKIYLNASAEERARRRYAQLKEKGFDATLATLIEDIQTRDDRDMNRDVAPLKPADDAVEIDSTSLSVEQVVDAILDEAARRSLV